MVPLKKLVVMCACHHRHVVIAQFGRDIAANNHKRPLTYGIQNKK